MKVLFLTSRLPWPVDRGDRNRTYHFLREMARRHDVRLLTFLESESERDGVPNVEALGVEVTAVVQSPFSSKLAMLGAVPSRRPFQVAYYASSRMRKRVASVSAGVDVVVAHLIRMAPYLAAVEPGPRRIVDLCDCISSEYEVSLPHRSGAARLFYAEEARRVAAYERALVDAIDEGWLISPAEIGKIAPGHPRLHVVPIGISIDDTPAPLAEEPRLAFTGNMSVPHNVDAAAILVREVLPIVAQSVPDVHVTLAGAGAGPGVRALAGPRVDVTGWVPDLRDVLSSSRVFVAPMRFVAGVQTKVLDAMALGLPVVTTPLVERGVGGTDGENLLAGQTADELAGHVVHLLEHPAEAERLGAAGREHVRQRFSWNVVVERLEAGGPS